jgi:hypothetical protein
MSYKVKELIESLHRENVTGLKSYKVGYKTHWSNEPMEKHYNAHTAGEVLKSHFDLFGGDVKTLHVKKADGSYKDITPADHHDLRNKTKWADIKEE